MASLDPSDPVRLIVPKLVYDVAIRDWLLAKAIPARTAPMGSAANTSSAWMNRNFDMLPMFAASGWPRREEVEGGGEEDAWWHSDYEDVAYLYTHALYNKFVELSKEPSP